MSSTNTAMLHRMYDHLQWADDLSYSEVGSMSRDTPEFARAEAIYAHLASTQQVWLARIEGSSARNPIWPDIGVDAAHGLFADGIAGFRAILNSIDAHERSLDDAITYRNSRGDEFTNSVGDTLVHVALHGSYHRGQLALLARQSGAQPVLTDYIAYVRTLPV